MTKPAPDQQPPQREVEKPSRNVRRITKPTGNDTLELIVDGFKSRLKKAAALPDMTEREQAEKSQEMMAFITVINAKLQDFLNEKKTKEELSGLKEVLEEARKINKGLNEKIQAHNDHLDEVEKITVKVTEAFEKAQKKPTREEKKKAFAGILQNIRKTPELLKDKGITSEDLKELEKTAQEGIHQLEREELEEEFEAIIQADRDKEVPRVLKEKLDLLKGKLASVPETESLMGEVQQALKNVQQVLDAKEERAKEIANDVRRAGATVRLYAGEASRATDPEKKMEYTVKAIQAIKDEIIRDGTVDTERAEGLREQFQGAAEYRSIWLDWVIKNPTLEITPKNLDEMTRNTSGSNQQEADRKTSEEKCDFFRQERKRIENIGELGKRFGELSKLLQSIRTANAQDSSFAQQFGDELSREVNQDWLECKQQVSENLYNIKAAGLGNPDDSNNALGKIDKVEQPDDLTPDDTQVISRLLDSALMEKKDVPIEGPVPDFEESQMPRLPEPVDFYEDFVPKEKKNRASKIAGITAAVTLAIAAVIISRIPKEHSNPAVGIAPPTSASDGKATTSSVAHQTSKTIPEPAPVISSTAAVHSSQPAPVQSSITPVDSTQPAQPSPEELARRALEALRNELTRKLEAIEGDQSSPLEVKISQLGVLIPLLEAQRSNSGFEMLFSRASELLKRLENEQAAARIAQLKTQFETRLRDISGSDEQRKPLLEALIRDLRAAPPGDYVTVLSDAVTQLQQVETRLETSARRVEFERRFREISGTDELRKPLLEALIRDLRNAPQGDYGTVLADAVTQLQQVESRIAGAARRAEFERRFREMSGTDEQKVPLLEQLIRDLEQAPADEQGAVLADAKKMLQEIQTRFTPPSPVQPEPTPPTGPSELSQLTESLQMERRTVQRLQRRVRELETLQEQWTNHLVLEDAQQRRQALDEIARQLEPARSEFEEHEFRKTMLERVIGLRRSALQERSDELTRTIAELRRQSEEMQIRVLRFEGIRARTPGEDRSLENGRQWLEHYRREISRKNEERTLITRRANSSHPDDQRSNQ